MVFLQKSLAVTSLLLSLALAPTVVRAQQDRPGPADEIHHDTRAKMEKQRREEEWQKLRDDSDKLVQATGELKEMIEKSNKDTFSIQLVKKTEEVEKILKEIKRRAKGGF